MPITIRTNFLYFLFNNVNVWYFNAFQILYYIGEVFLHSLIYIEVAIEMLEVGVKKDNLVSVWAFLLAIAFGFVQH